TTTATPVPQDTEATTPYVPDAPRLPKLCLLDEDPGETCDSQESGTLTDRYFFNHNESDCQSFIYYGCKGNENNFLDEKTCKKRCTVGEPYDTKADARLPEVCKQRMVKGSCVSGRDPELRHFYNQYTQRCELFAYSGCEGNENNFKTRDECEARCIYTPDGACSLQPEKGPCSMHWTRYHWDKQLGDCREFIYSGCAGNDNNFASREECRKYCNGKYIVSLAELLDEVW
ncbi:unnamed protein product, partial [Ixodes hexagonus]